MLPTLSTTQPRFPLGELVATPGALQALADAVQIPSEFLRRHVSGDWGDLCTADAQENEASLTNGNRIFSVYHTALGDKLYIITECDRSVTTLLLAGEY